MHSDSCAMGTAVQAAQGWIREVAAELGTPDEEFAHRALRAWLHTLRDRLTVEVCADFAAPLPDLIRGEFYAGWNPAKVPVRRDAKTYTVRFARTAGICVQDVGAVAALTTAAMLRLLPADRIEALDQLPPGVRNLPHTAVA